jgi:hypothetical protein
LPAQNISGTFTLSSNPTLTVDGNTIEIDSATASYDIGSPVLARVSLAGYNFRNMPTETRTGTLDSTDNIPEVLTVGVRDSKGGIIVPEMPVNDITECHVQLNRVYEEENVYLHVNLRNGEGAALYQNFTNGLLRIRTQVSEDYR